jgi:hypothetical protein
MTKQELRHDITWELLGAYDHRGDSGTLPAAPKDRRERIGGSAQERVRFGRRSTFLGGVQGN